MTRSERLDVVKQATAHNEREHAERVAAAERHVVEMEEKLQALERYRKEYEDGFAARAGAGLGVAAMRDFQAFLARLGDALEQQRQVVEQARAAHQATILVWREAAKRAHVVDTLAERWQIEESREEGRRDQRDNDELSQQMRFNRERKT
ncbi:MAG TPA: flagellar export protein FliJ [Steroidobacteraceae bacterium]|nr:flagellar export protein FliJ [Steroidobacteraceae bacterium]